MVARRYTSKQMYDWLREASAEQLEEFVQADAENKVYTCTAGPRDMLFTPPLYAFFEKVANSDCAGAHIKYTSLTELERYEEYCDELKKLGRTNEVAAKVKDFLLLSA